MKILHFFTLAVALFLGLGMLTSCGAKGANSWYAQQEQKTAATEAATSNATEEEIGTATFALTQRIGDVIYEVEGRFDILPEGMDRTRNEAWYRVDARLGQGEKYTIKGMYTNIPFEIFPVGTINCYANGEKQEVCEFLGSTPDPFETEANTTKEVILQFRMGSGSNVITVLCTGSVQFEIDVEVVNGSSRCNNGRAEVNLWGTPACVDRCGGSCTGCGGNAMCEFDEVCWIPANPDPKASLPGVCVSQP